MVLAVHVVGDGAAQGHEPRAGRGRREPAARHGDGQELVERQARLGAQDARRRIEGDQVVQARGVDQAAAGIERADVVGAPGPNDDEAMGSAGPARRFCSWSAKRGRATRCDPAPMRPQARRSGAAGSRSRQPRPPDERREQRQHDDQAGLVAHGEGDRIVIHLAAMSQQPDARDPEQQQRRRPQQARWARRPRGRPRRSDTAPRSAEATAAEIPSPRVTGPSSTR